uniref:Uncharacterized protein n=1 Tax=Cucumis melo TaxID=3656 RepID=A0A9I9EFL1_CUCME
MVTHDFLISDVNTQRSRLGSPHSETAEAPSDPNKQLNLTGTHAQLYSNTIAGASRAVSAESMVFVGDLIPIGQENSDWSKVGLALDHH